MDADSIDWVFDASRGGTFPKGGGAEWRLIVKYWVLASVLTCLASVAVLLTVIIRPKGMDSELVFAIISCVLIFVFCVFLVWKTYHRRVGGRRERLSEDVALNREIARYYREQRQQEIKRR